MEAKDLLQKIKSIEIKSRKLSNQIFAGEYHSSFKGKGMTFSEVREYQYGDPIKSIDWNVTARFNHPFVKIFEEERELTVMLVIDVSNSKVFGTQDRFKQELVAEIAAVLAFSTIQNNDKIGVILFSDSVEKFIIPQKGKKHILRIILEILNFEPKSKKTDVNEALKYLTNAIKKRCTAFVISDFITPDFSEALKISANKHDIAALRIYDKFETEIPNIGLAYFHDLETNKYKWIDTSIARIRRNYAQWYKEKHEKNSEVFRKSKVDFIDIESSEDYVKSLLKLFRQR